MTFSSTSSDLVNIYPETKVGGPQWCSGKTLASHLKKFSFQKWRPFLNFGPNIGQDFKSACISLTIRDRSILLTLYTRMAVDPILQYFQVVGTLFIGIANIYCFGWGSANIDV